MELPKKVVTKMGLNIKNTPTWVCLGVWHKQKMRRTPKTHPHGCVLGVRHDGDYRGCAENKGISNTKNTPIWACFLCLVGRGGEGR